MVFPNSSHADDGRADAADDPTPYGDVNRATLASETEYLRLERPTRDAAVLGMDTRLAPQPPAIENVERMLSGLVVPVERPAPPPHQEPMPRGKLQRFDDFTGDGRTVFRYQTWLGGAVLFALPSSVCTADIEADISAIVAKIERTEAGL